MHIFIIAGRGEDRKSADKSEGRLRQRILFYLHPDKNEKKETVVNDSTEVKADKEATSTKHEETKTEEVKDKKESTLPEQIGFACVCVTVLIVVMLVVRKHWGNRQSSS